jgi:hypothetical protein
MSAIEQYCEAVPGPGGDRGNGDHDRGGGPLPAETVRALERSGADGRAIVASSGGAQSGGAAQPSAGKEGSAPAATAEVHRDQPANDPIAAVGASFGTGDGTVGREFGTVLLVLTLVFIAGAWVRYRGRAQD